MVVVDLKENTIPFQGICPRWSYHRSFKQREIYFYRYCRTSTQMNSEKSTQHQSLMVVITGITVGCSSYSSFQSTASVGTWFIVIVLVGHGSPASFFFSFARSTALKPKGMNKPIPKSCFCGFAVVTLQGQSLGQFSIYFGPIRRGKLHSTFEQGRFDINNYLIWIG